MTWHQIERAQLATALTEAGPDAPTLCAGWRSRHLAAHVVLRESSALVGAGIVVPALADRSERAIQELGDSARSPEAYADLVRRVAEGPGRAHPTAWFGDQVNLVELFVHTEDVRRGAGQVPAPELDPAHLEALWGQLVRTARLAYRRVPTGIVLVRPDGLRCAVKHPRTGHGSVVVRGEVSDLLLHSMGRGAATHIRVDGMPADVASIRAAYPLPTR